MRSLSRRRTKTETKAELDARFAREMTEAIDGMRAVGVMDTPKRIHNPAHPGEVIRATCLEPLNLSVTAAAKGLGVTRKALFELLSGHSGISAEMAIRLQKVGWSTAETWLRMQMQYDLWHAEQRADKIKVTPFAVPAAA